MALELEISKLREFLDEIERRIDRGEDKGRWCVWRSDCLKAIAVLTVGRMRTVE